MSTFTLNCESTIFTDEIKKHINPPKKFEYYILWGIYDLYPSMDSYRPPILSGCSFNKNEVFTIAKQFGLENDFIIDNKAYINKRFSEGFTSEQNSLLVAYTRKSKGFHFLAWKSFLHYILDIPPVIEDFYSEEKVKNTLLNNDMYYIHKFADSWKMTIEKAVELHIKSINQRFTKEMNGFFIKNHIRRQEAKRNFTKTQIKHSKNILFIDFLYTQGHVIKNKRFWLRHRILKVNDRYTYVDKFPYYGGSYLAQGWHNFIIYTCRLDTKKLDDFGVCYSRSVHKNFYRKEKLTNDLIDDHLKTFLKENGFDGFDDFDSIIVAPQNTIGWALELLNIKSNTPTEKEVKKAFVTASLKHHPDRGGDAKEFIKCTAARDFLMDWLKVTAY